MNHGQIKKLKVDTGFTQIPNSIARDTKLSAKEKGILVCLLSLPDDWIIYKTQLHKFFSDGRDGIINGFNSLIEKGYIQTERVHEPNGQFVGYNYLVSPFPSFTESVPEKPIPAEPLTVKPFTENTELRKKDSTKKEFTKKKIGLDFDLSKLTLPFATDEFLDAWARWVELRNGTRKKLSTIAAAAQLKLLAKYESHVAVEIIETSINNQWQGLFDPKFTRNGKQQINGGGTHTQFATRREKYSQLDNNARQ